MEGQRLADLVDEKNQLLETVKSLTKEKQVLLKQNTCISKEVRQLQIGLEDKKNKIDTLTAENFQTKKEHEELVQQHKDLRIANAKCTKKLEELENKNKKLHQKYEHVSYEKENLSLKNQQLSAKLKERQEAGIHLQQEIGKQTQMKDASKKKLLQVEEEKAEVASQNEALRVQISGLEKDLEASKKEVETERKTIKDITQERDTLKAQIKKVSLEVQKHQDLLKDMEKEKVTFLHDINGHKQETVRQHKVIQQLEAEKIILLRENSKLDQQVKQNNLDIYARDMDLAVWKKKLTEVKEKLHDQKKEIKEAMIEKDESIKSLYDAQVDNAKIREKMKTMNGQVSDLKDDITQKDVALARDHLKYQHLEKDNQNVKRELQLMIQQLEETKKCVDHQKAEQKNLQEIIAAAKTEQAAQQKELEQVKAERNVLSQKLLKCNKMCSMLQKKIKLQKSMLSKGDFHFQQRIDKIHLMKMEIKGLKHKICILEKAAPNTDQLRQDMSYLESDLLKEKMRNSCLKEQLKPVNIHRWRRLEGIDPNMFKLLEKVQALQKRLIAKTQEVQECERLLQEKEKLYVELKAALERRPGLDVAEQLQRYHYSLSEKTKQLKASMAEIAMLHSGINEYKRENERLNKDVKTLKMHCLTQKKLHSGKPMKALPVLSSRPQGLGGALFHSEGKTTFPPINMEETTFPQIS